MTSHDHNVADLVQTLKENPYKNDYDWVSVEKIIKVGNTTHCSTVEAYCSGPRLAKLINEHRNAVEDIFYDYKDDIDLDFNIYCTCSADANALYKHLLLKGQHTLIAFDNNENGSGHFIVIVSVKTLDDKEAFVSALRNLKFNPNGG